MFVYSTFATMKSTKSKPLFWLLLSSLGAVRDAYETMMYVLKLNLFSQQSSQFYRHTDTGTDTDGYNKPNSNFHILMDIFVTETLITLFFLLAPWWKKNLLWIV